MENSLCQGHVPVLGGDGEQGSIIRSGSGGFDQMMRDCFFGFLTNCIVETEQSESRTHGRGETNGSGRREKCIAYEA